MPPKARKPDPKKQEPTEDESGIPKNDVLFKFSFQVKQNEVADILLMFEWVNASDSSQREKLDSDLIESWTQASPTDPAVLNYELEVPSSYRIDDRFVKNFCRDKFFIHFVSTEDQCIKDTIYLHYSPILTAKGEQPKFESYHDKIKIPQIESFKVTLSADKELLTPMYKDFLNPLEICIVGGKEMPINNTSYNKYEPVYVQAKFFDGTLIKTQDLPHSSTCKWKYRQVIPVGFMDHIKLLEALRTMSLKFEVHDQDELSKNNIKDFKQLIDIKYQEPAPPVEVADPKAKGKAGAKKAEDPKKDDKAKEAAKAKDAKGKKDVKKKKDTKTFEPIKPKDDREFVRTNYGVSNFNLNDLLNPHVSTLKLRNYIVPIQKYENKDSTNLDLNTTARRELQGAHIACDYINNDSYLVVTFEIAHAIRLFKKPPPPAVPEVQVTETQGKGKGKPAAAKPITPAQKGRLPTAQEKRPESATPTPVVEEKPVFERAIYVFPYKSRIETPKLLSIIQKINMEAFGQADGNPLFITTKALSEEEKRSKQLDIITGLEFIDNEYRTFILEGISDKAMKRLEEEFPKVQPNSKALKILKNSDVKFKDRMYADCNIDIKKIRLRENLAKLLIRPEIYLRSKVPEHIYGILISFCELRRCENIRAVVASNLFPDLEDVLSMERKYGDALTDEDISGIEGLPQKLVTRTVGKLASMGSDMTLSGAMTQSTSRGMQSKSVAFPKDSSAAIEKPLENVTNKNLAHLRTMIDNPKTDKYNLHMNKLYPVNDGQEVHTRANTKLNIYEQQKAELREIARNDPNHFYTYSVNYLSQSIDPYSPDDIKRLEEEHKKKMWKTPNGFQTILKKDKKDYIEHPKKPHQSKVDELTTYPWHQDKLEETKKLSNSRGEPIRNGVDFKLRIGGIDVFSAPETVEEELITAVEKERRIKEAKRLAEEEWKKKVVVDKEYFYTSTCTNKSSQLDKIKGIREGEARKKGLMMKDSRLKQTTLGTTKTIPENPISMYLEHEWEETSTKNLFERQVDLKKTTSEFDFRRNIKEAHQYDFIYKPMKETFPKLVQ